MKNNSTLGVVGVIIVVATVLTIAVVLSNIDTNRPSQPQPSVAATGNLVGKPLPILSLKDRTGKTYNFTNLKGKNAVLFFSEGLKCYPACWNQIEAFGTDTRFNNKDTVAVSIIADPPSDWQRAINAMPKLASATVLFDTTLEASGQLGLLSVPSSMHGGQFPGHTYVILDKMGVVRQVIDDVTMSINNNKIINEFSNIYN